MEPELFTTADGSHSLRSPQFSAAYHSTHGAINESRHIYIESGLLPYLERGQAAIRVLEMGLGTGLNALLSWNHLRKFPTIRVDYTAFESFPISAEQAEQLNYPELLKIPRDPFLALHRAEFGKVLSLGEQFCFTKYRQDFLAASPTPDFDLIYYDAFAPEQQPELWTVEAMAHCARWLKPGGTLVTYCAKGQFKRNLRAAGFQVEALPGPIGKREITRANLVNLA
ncbi:tRNA U34 5-methylaminomethyl-2-thiouridine-forming methyltransferase MnmC [Neolewinella xylanilytica]|uniref:tRNA U34 5-methylaminomethyl-2-thiouridine-forming methyltransferase MnmC n=1 Tax=Neolewinella xylanilytica TaxID=1514080 RepID=A0A2S6I3Q1_9BACT|nr:tRNA (5-methylaminomethyl-2-thiouridine)(34)-methyltransferase MnmD [Neolewinella xylanilytica]PPK85790.1 tRNA U34 5-methylaminomethyl-2-thiouridine-forming methyltransferase MnmC [Neolewinella xylanilytica]